MEIIEFKEEYLDVVYDIQQKSFMPLFEKYQDIDTNPIFETKEIILEKYTKTGVHGYVFQYEDTIVGAVRVTIYEDKSAKISNLCVLPEYQGMGIAQKVMHTLEKKYPDVKKWFLWTILQEKGNCYLYEKMKYEHRGDPIIVNPLMTLIYYEKKL